MPCDAIMRTLEQCKAAAAGALGHCVANPEYTEIDDDRGPGCCGAGQIHDDSVWRVVMQGDPPSLTGRPTSLGIIWLA